MIGEEPAAALREVSLALYARAAAIARDRGIILADTKFEFGVGPSGGLVLGDEVLTPDSSRFWPADQWVPGRVTPSFDKQYVRDWLASPASGWDRSSRQVPPALPADVVERTRARYLEAYERLTGSPLPAPGARAESTARAASTGPVESAPPSAPTARAPVEPVGRTAPTGPMASTGPAAPAVPVEPVAPASPTAPTAGPR